MCLKALQRSFLVCGGATLEVPSPLARKSIVCSLCWPPFTVLAQRHVERRKDQKLYNRTAKKGAGKHLAIKKFVRNYTQQFDHHKVGVGGKCAIFFSRSLIFFPPVHARFSYLLRLLQPPTPTATVCVRSMRDTNAGLHVCRSWKNRDL